MSPGLEYSADEYHYGIKALVFCLMNTLATDQAKCYEKKIYRRSELRGSVRVGLSVGASEATSQTEIINASFGNGC
ncbi:hypothetical protein GCM10011297_10320 [Bacterioplanes sanyensis]|uniref:hypothetical protein n=1 Tax=Bacterioplanes sanyensis TaxID=1249553 RepID=UPI0019CBB695|nr:hypothetical protein [Bacterioplanes sanyensis]GGY39056.1 hypothetical protein GCM10011297_10320 [Bacterioplanes sanyensis]